MQEFCFAEYTKLAFKDAIDAWIYGPVVKFMHRAFLQYGRAPSMHLSDGKTLLNYDGHMQSPEEHVVSARLPDRAAKAAKIVVSAYGKYGGMDLLKMSHCEDTPWHKAHSPCRNNAIPAEHILERYKNLAEATPDAGL